MLTTTGGMLIGLEKTRLQNELLEDLLEAKEGKVVCQYSSV
jgi:hypothetical protein